MSKIFIVGGAGQIARLLTPMLVERGHAVSSLYRRPEQKGELADLGATPVEGDLSALSADGLGALMNGHDEVLFAAGAGGASIEAVDQVDDLGARNTVDAAKRLGMKRMLMISAFMDAGRRKSLSDTFEHYMAAKRQADAYLVGSGLPFAIIRPGTLTDDAGTGHVHADFAIPYGTIPRPDVAAFLAAVIDRPSLDRFLVELTSGDRTPDDVAEAFAS